MVGPELIGHTIFLTTPAQLICVPFNLLPAVWENQIVATTQYLVEMVSDRKVGTCLVFRFVFFALFVSRLDEKLFKLAHGGLDVTANLYLECLA
ncbi:hypothetical protein D3C84_1015830 [compost metagenome]